MWATDFLSNFWNIPKVIGLWREAQERLIHAWGEMSTTVMSLAQDADLIFSGPGFPGIPANVAEYYDIPLAVMHYFPMRPTGQLAPGSAGSLGSHHDVGAGLGAMARDQGRRGRAAP